MNKIKPKAGAVLLGGQISILLAIWLKRFFPGFEFDIAEIQTYSILIAFALSYYAKDFVEFVSNGNEPPPAAVRPERIHVLTDITEKK
jgi:hypothetical protein